MKNLLLLLLLLFACKPNSDLPQEINLTEMFVNKFIDGTNKDIPFFDKSKLNILGIGENYNYSGIEINFINPESINKLQQQQDNKNIYLVYLSPYKLVDDFLEVEFSFLKGQLVKEKYELSLLDNSNVKYRFSLNDKKVKAVR